MLDLAAFVLWALATRGPGRLLYEMRTAVREPRRLARGCVAFLAGLALLVGGATLLVPLSPDGRTFTTLETWTIVTALLADQLVGPDALRLLRRR